MTGRLNDTIWFSRRLKEQTEDKEQNELKVPSPLRRKQGMTGSPRGVRTQQSDDIGGGSREERDQRRAGIVAVWGQEGDAPHPENLRLAVAARHEERQHGAVVGLGLLDVPAEHVEREQVPSLISPHRHDALDRGQCRAQLRDLRDVAAISAGARVRRRAALDTGDRTARRRGRRRKKRGGRREVSAMALWQPQETT